MTRFFVLFAFSFSAAWALPANFVSITEVDPSIIVEPRYFQAHNFVGQRIDGYQQGKCILTLPAAKALKRAQIAAKKMGYSLKTYDCYRPQMAVDHFVRWAKDLEDQKMKGEFYPELKKESLFSLGYISKKSGHSRGSTVDLTLVKLPPADQPSFDPDAALLDCRSSNRFQDNTLDMGTGYDCFDPLSHTQNELVGKSALANRLLLKSIMEKAGFKNYSKEWWHYTLKKEPHPRTYFNFPVK